MPVSTSGQQHQCRKQQQMWSPPLKVVRTEAKGRCFIAVRDLWPGEILLRSLPYAAVPDSGSRTSVCAGCLSRNCVSPVRPCRGGCGHAYYCCDECERQDAARGHAPCECAFLRRLFRCRLEEESAAGAQVLAVKEVSGSLDLMKLGAYTLDYTWLLLRILTRRFLELSAPTRVHHASKSNIGEVLQNPLQLQPAFEDVWCLCSNRASFSPDRQREFYAVAAVLRQYVEELLGINGTDFSRFFPPMLTEDIIRPATASAAAESVLGRPVSAAELDLLDPLVALICKEECNSFGLYSFADTSPASPRQGYALALYVEPVYFNHSCSPSARQFTPAIRSLSPAGDAVGSGPPARLRPIEKPAFFYALERVTRGQEVTISYVSLTHHDELDRTCRKRALQDMFFFDCDCRRCNPEESKRNGTTACTEDDWPPNGVCFRFPECRGWYVPFELLQGRASYPDDEEEDGAGIKSTDCAGCRWVCEACGDLRAEL